MREVVLEPSCRSDCAGDIKEQYNVLHSEVVESNLGQYSSVELASSSFGHPVVQFFDALRHRPSGANRQLRLKWTSEVAMPAFGTASAPLRPRLFLLHEPGHLFLEFRGIDSFHLDHAIDWLSNGLREQQLDGVGLGMQRGSVGEENGAVESGEGTGRVSFEFEGSLHLISRIIINHK